MQKGQASAEHLMLLGAVLIVGLVAIGLFMFYFGTSEEKNRTQNDIYWHNAQPMAVRDALGFAGSYILRVKNLGSETVYVEGARIGNGSMVGISFYGDVYDEAGLTQRVQPNTCYSCQVELAPGAELFIQFTAFDEGGGGNPWSGEPKEACGLSDMNGTGSAYFNSLRKYAKTPLSIHYNTGSRITQVQMGSVDLFVDCADYDFRCSVGQDCTDKYCFRSPCVQGMCGTSC